MICQSRLNIQAKASGALSSPGTPKWSVSRGPVASHAWALLGLQTHHPEGAGVMHPSKGLTGTSMVSRLMWGRTLGACLSSLQVIQDHAPQHLLWFL